jgi:hypothetical protein
MSPAQPPDMNPDEDAEISGEIDDPVIAFADDVFDVMERLVQAQRRFARAMTGAAGERAMERLLAQRAREPEPDEDEFDEDELDEDELDESESDEDEDETDEDAEDEDAEDEDETGEDDDTAADDDAEADEVARDPESAAAPRRPRVRRGQAR